MKNRRAVGMPMEGAGGIAPLSSASAPAANSSAILGATLLAELDDISAVLRTAILLGRSLHSSVSIDILGRNTVQIGVGEEVLQASLPSLLDSIQNLLRKHGPAGTPVFVLEASITAASFLSSGVVSVRIRAAESNHRRPVIAK